MFGEPENNPFNWKRCFLNDVMSAPASNGFFTKPENYCDNGNVGIICVGDVVNRQYSNVNNLRRANADEKQINKFGVKYGDMLFCRSSLVKEGIAKASIVPMLNNINVLFECHVIRIPLDLKIVVPEFLQVFSTTDYFRQQMIQKSKTATMTTIGQKDIISGMIFLPPIELQKSFLEFVKQVDKSKFIVQKQIDDLQELLDSKMDEYFG